MILFKRPTAMSPTYLLVVSVLIFTLSAYAGDNLSQYVNSEYGFSIEVPLDRPICRAEPDTHDTGIMIFLDHGPSDCANQNQRPFIAVNGTYNATSAPNPQEALLIECRGAKPQFTDAHVFGDLAKRWPAMCRLKREDGFVEYVLIRQSRSMAADRTPSINFSIVVHVQTGDSQAIEKAKTILRSVQAENMN